MKQYEITEKTHSLIQLIHLAEVNYCVVRKLYEEHIDKNNPNKSSALRLMANNSFNSTIILLHTLLEDGSKKALRIRAVLDAYDSSKLSELEVIENNFTGYDLHKVRHQSVAHKNEKLKEPASESTLLIQEDYLDKVEDVLFTLRDKFCEWFNYSKHNPTFVALDDLKNFPKEETDLIMKL